MIDIQVLQDEIWENKLAKGFNTTSIETEFNLTYAELAEAYDAYRKRQANVGEELADVMIFTLCLAKMLNVDLEQELVDKIAKNKTRTYRTVGGHKVKVEGEQS